MGVKAKGKRLNFGTIKNVKFIDPLPYDEPEEEEDVAEVDEVEAEEVMDDIDMQVAKEIYDNVDETQSSKKIESPRGEDQGEQLSLF